MNLRKIYIFFTTSIESFDKHMVYKQEVEKLLSANNSSFE